MSAFESSGDELGPDGRELIDTCAEEGDALSACDFAVEVKFLGDLSEYDEVLRCDFSAEYSWDYGVGAAALYVGEEAVVGILDGFVVLNHVVPGAGEYRGYGWFTHFATVACTGVFEELFVGSDVFEFDDVCEFLTRECEVFADDFFDGLS